MHIACAVQAPSEVMSEHVLRHSLDLLYHMHLLSVLQVAREGYLMVQVEAHIVPVHSQKSSASHMLLIASVVALAMLL